MESSVATIAVEKLRPTRLAETGVVRVAPSSRGDRRAAPRGLQRVRRAIAAPILPANLPPFPEPSAQAMETGAEPRNGRTGHHPQKQDADVRHRESPPQMSRLFVLSSTVYPRPHRPKHHAVADPRPRPGPGPKRSNPGLDQPPSRPCDAPRTRASLLVKGRQGSLGCATAGHISQRSGRRRRHASSELATPIGFEPTISTLTGWRVRPGYTTGPQAFR